MRHVRCLGADDDPTSAKTNGSSPPGTPSWLPSSRQGAIQSNHSGQSYCWSSFKWSLLQVRCQSMCGSNWEVPKVNCGCQNKRSTDRVLDFTYKGPRGIMENVIKEICCTVNPVLLECNRIDVKLCSAEGKRRLRH